MFFFVLIMLHQKVSCHVYFCKKIEKLLLSKKLQSFKECLLFVFWLFYLVYYLICTLCKRMGKEPIWKTKAKKRKGEQTFCFCCCIEETINFVLLLCWKKQKNKGNVDSLLFLSTLRGSIFPWALSRNLITWAKCVTLTIFAKNPRKIDKYFTLTKSNLRENSFTHLRHFQNFILFVFIKK